MHMAIGSALSMFDNRIAPYFTDGHALDGSDSATNPKFGLTQPPTS
jgi:hypothetical protein